MTGAEAPPLPDDLEDLWPACVLIYLVLESYGPHTSSEIADEFHLTTRTVRHAIRALRKEGLVESRTDPRDARRKLHLVAGEGE